MFLKRGIKNNVIKNFDRFRFNIVTGAQILNLIRLPRNITYFCCCDKLTFRRYEQHSAATRFQMKHSIESQIFPEAVSLETLLAIL